MARPAIHRSYQVRDLVTGYPSADSIGIPTTETLIDVAGERIELFDDTLGAYLDLDGITELLIQKAQEGVQVRILVSETSHQLVSLLDQPGIELRAGEPDEHQAIHRYDDQLLIILPLAGEPDDPPPVLHVRRKGAGGLFDRFTAHFEDSWEHATPLRTNADIRDYLTEDEFDPENDGITGDRDDRNPETASAPSVEAPVSPPRHWPRRPS